MITLLHVRSGFLQGLQHFFFEHAIGDPGDQISAFLLQYINRAGQLPPEILVSHLPADKEYLEELLAEKKGRKVAVVTGVRGDRAKLLAMAAQNARNELEQRKRTMDARLDLLVRLQYKLGMSALPRRIECFDNSNWSGQEPVSAMVVFVNGQPKPDAYRKYRIHQAGLPDDYAYMSEVLRRRFGKQDPAVSLPELLLVDGGKGQLNVALAALNAVGVDDQFSVAGIAKKDPGKGEHQDKVFLAGRSNPVNFGRDMDLLLLLQQIRDEAHRWAVGYQRKRRQMTNTRSVLDEIDGIGPKRKAMLLKHFGGLEQMRQASLSEIEALAGITPQLAEKIKSALLSK